MNKNSTRKIVLLSFLLIISVGIFFRFFDYNWGAPFYFHPDERNIASAVTRLEFPNNLNPEFFAYGSFPIYLIYFLGILQNLLTNASEVLNVTFEQAIIFSRLISATFSTLIIFTTYILLRKKLNTWHSMLGAFLASFNVGLIQYAHFGTFEIWLTLLFLVLFWSLLNYLKNGSINFLILTSIIFGLLVSVKVSSVAIAPLVICVILFRFYKSKYFEESKLLFFRKSLSSLLIFAILSASTLITTHPYLLLDNDSFINSMNYESGVALGSINVFYTGGFVDTIPVLYQLTFVYPYLINPINLIIILLITPLLIFSAFKKRDEFILLALAFFAIIFLSQTFLYVKWIRYYIPTIPFLLMLIPIGFKLILDKYNNKNFKTIYSILVALVLVVAFVFSFSYFKTALLDKDTRLEASDFASKNIPNDSMIISEVYDLGVVPFNRHFSNITLFDFYALDDRFQKNDKREKLDTLIDQSDYLILPSQRILRNRTIYKDDFPEGNSFYNRLKGNDFELIYKTECDIYCKVLYMGDPIYNVEETANVFDRPVIMIYKIN